MIPRFLIPLLVLSLPIHAKTLYFDNFDDDGIAKNTGIGGGATNHSIQSASWTDNAQASYGSADSKASNRAMLVSQQSFQSEHGFTLNFVYTGSKSQGAEQLAIGLISSDTDLNNYKGGNPFTSKKGLPGIGINILSKTKSKASGAYFNNGTSAQQLDKSGTRAQFDTKKPCLVSLEIEKNGYWCYRINGAYEASGVLLQGLDLNKKYHVAVYAQGTTSKSLEYIKLDTGYATGERAFSSKGTWSGGMGLDKIENLRTLDTVQVRFTDGAVLSASHWAPQKLIEELCLGKKGNNSEPLPLCLPTWGDLNKDEPSSDLIRQKVDAIKAKGFKVKAYANCENFNGKNSPSLEAIAKRWMEYCDTDPKVVAFVNSQPYHTGIWDQKENKYVDASKKFPKRKYMFCYAEFVLKDYALRYGKDIDAWIFDSAKELNSNGDVSGSGVIEEQRLYQAFAKAVHAGNPNIAIAFNNGRSTVKKPSFPFATPTHYDDFTFGHAFGGNNNHGDKNGGTFNRNYLHVKKMTSTQGHVFTGGKWKWDDQIVGNFHSKLSTAGWKSGGRQAWEEPDFLQWNLEAMRAGGIMTWDGSATSKKQRNWILRDWSANLLKALDDHLAVHQFPGQPNWARAYTVLPIASVDKPFKHTLTVGEDLWDPEGDTITEIKKSSDAPKWLKIKQHKKNPKIWELSGKPTAVKSWVKSITFTLHAKDATGKVGSRKVELRIQPRK